MGTLRNKKPRTGYSRPEANMSTNHDKQWQHVTVEKLNYGDIIAGRGQITMIFESCDNTWYVEAGQDTEEFFPGGTQFYAFTRKAD